MASKPDLADLPGVGFDGISARGLRKLLSVLSTAGGLRQRIADDDPWEADTLEWATSSPPPPYNFARIPVVHSARPLKEDVH